MLNKMTYLERFSDTKKEANTKANFFEASITSYVIDDPVARQFYTNVKTIKN